MTTTTEHAAPTRRQALLKGGLVVGAVWTAPVVTKVGLVPASAQSASGQLGTGTLPGSGTAPGAALPVIHGTTGSGSRDYAFTTGTQTGRLYRGGEQTTCTTNHTESLFDTNGHVYDAYGYDITTSGCRTFAVTASNDVFVAVYRGSYDPAHPTANVAGDAGLSGNVSFTVTLAAGTHIVIVASEVNTGHSGSSYVITTT